jgi:hypothetical protein
MAPLVPPAARRIVRSEPISNSLGRGDDLLKVGRGKHLEPGVVAYDNEDGSRITYLLTREAIEAMRASAKGIPLVGKAGGFDHVKVEKGKKYDGEVLESYAGPDGWEYMLFQINDQATAGKCADGFQLSCAYIPTEVDETPGVWHNVPYDAIIRNGQYTHLAVVPNPRYDGATIELLNSNGGIVNKALKSILAALVPAKQLREIVNSIEEDEKAKADADKAAKKAEAQNAFDAAMKDAKTPEEQAAAKAALDKANAALDAPETPAGAPEAGKEPQKAPVAAPEAPVEAPKADLPPQPLGGGDVTPEPGMPGQGPKKAPQAANDAPPAPAAGAPAVPPAVAAEAAAEGETPAQEAAEKAALEKKNAEEAAAAEKAKKDAEAKAEAERERQNAIKTARAVKEALMRERFNDLRQRAAERGGSAGTPFVGHTSASDKENLGRERYGSRK